eukprot:2500882-Rhodomonas_salina.1
MNSAVTRLRPRPWLGVTAYCTCPPPSQPLRDELSCTQALTLRLRLEHGTLSLQVVLRVSLRLAAEPASLPNHSLSRSWISVRIPFVP